jgi:branched-chain amino acid transport system substrate-binding protein
MRLASRHVLAGSLLMLATAALSACGGSSRAGGTAAAANTSSATTAGNVVDVYSSLPMRGPSATESAALVNGIQLALDQAAGRAGPFTVHYTPLDDSLGRSGWDANETAADARKAAGDPRAVYYIGESDDAASEVSMPILNQADIAQVSPTNTYVGLTVNQSRQPAGGPPYAPTGTRNYLRIVPADSVQGAALLEAMKQAGCRSVAVIDDQEPYGAGLAKLVEAQKGSYGVDVVSVAGTGAGVRGYRSDATLSRRGRPDCVLLAGLASPRAVRLTEEVHAALPNARIFAPGGMCTSAWTNPREGGVSADIDPLIQCTAVTLSLSAYPGGQKFLEAYRHKYGVSDPSTYAILGYEAMRLGLNTIAGLGSHGSSKSAVRGALFSITDRHSVLGTYGFDQDGDTTLRSYGLYRVGRSGDPVFVRTITPPGPSGPR